MWGRDHTMGQEGGVHSSFYLSIYLSIYHSIPFHSIPFHSIPFHSIPFHSIPFHSIPFHSILFYSILFYSILSTYTENFHRRSRWMIILALRKRRKGGCLTSLSPVNPGMLKSINVFFFFFFRFATLGHHHFMG